LRSVEVLVVGAGSAGRYAARQASRLGKTVILVETGPFGGLCILKGCMPSKAILRSAHILDMVRNDLRDLGLHQKGQISFDLPSIIKMKNRMIGEMADHARESVLNTDRISLVYESASFLSSDSARIGNEMVHFERAVIATGSIPKTPNIPGLSMNWVWTSDDILELEALPGAVIVLGAGPVGLELGQFLSMMGVEVTIIEIAAHWNSELDPRIQEGYIRSLQKKGLSIKLGFRSDRFSEMRGRPVLHGTVGHELVEVAADKILVATGRRPNIDTLNLGQAGVMLSRHQAIHVDEYLRTSNPRIFAAGDVTGHLPVLNLATYHGEIAGFNAASATPKKILDKPVPTAIFTEPEFARVGLSEASARALHRPILTGYLSFSDLGKAIVNRQTDGALKIVADKTTREILGAEMYGPGASDLIHLITVAMGLSATIDQYQRILHIHPTMAEIVKYVIDDMVEAL
jgi:dihydrolipoamide dehydrogenase/mercuric reductase